MRYFFSLSRSVSLVGNQTEASDPDIFVTTISDAAINSDKVMACREFRVPVASAVPSDDFRVGYGLSTGIKKPESFHG